MINAPDPTRTIEGLRDTGYTFDTSIADIIDNCISHGKAKNIWLDVSMSFEGLIALTITDDGAGMNEVGLINAMKYGSKTLTDSNSLGKFGMGMKTASSAFCRRYSMISRNDKKYEFKKVTWDLDHVQEENAWDMLEEPLTDEDTKLLKKYIGKGRGTIILWDKVDRVIREYAEPGGRFAQNALKKKLEGLEFHLGMVFQQFLDSSFKDIPDIQIKINDKIVEPWDPFCLEEKNSEKLAEQEMPIESGGITLGSFQVAAFAIPNRFNFSTDEAMKNARLSNKMQGFYVYRHGRLIYHGGWLGVRALEPHFTLSRIRLSFDYSLDNAFKVDLKKSRILLDQLIVDWLKNEFLVAPVREAERRYRKGKKASTQNDSKNAHHDSNILISNKEEDISQSTKNVIDEKTGETEITNKEGMTKVTLKIVQPENDNELHILTVPSLDDGVLWEPTVHDGKTAVLLNTSHDFYDRVYVPNHNESVTIQGLDALLWSLAESEYSTFNERTKKSFETLRYEVSKILRELSSELPES